MYREGADDEHENHAANKDKVRHNYYVNRTVSPDQKAVLYIYIASPLHYFSNKVLLVKLEWRKITCKIRPANLLFKCVKNDIIIGKVFLLICAIPF